MSLRLRTEDVRTHVFCVSSLSSKSIRFPFSFEIACPKYNVTYSSTSQLGGGSERSKRNCRMSLLRLAISSRNPEKSDIVRHASCEEEYVSDPSAVPPFPFRVSANCTLFVASRITLDGGMTNGVGAETGVIEPVWSWEVSPILCASYGPVLR